MALADGVLPLIPLDAAAPRPLHRQICDGLRSAIRNGSLLPGQRIPSSRELALALGVSRMPVATAYAQLTAEGYLEGRAGAGTCVSRGLPAPMPAPPVAAAPVRPPRLSALVGRLPRFTRPPWYGWGAFGVHQPALVQFPFALWSRLVARNARNPRTPDLFRMDPNGLPGLRQAIAAYLRTARGVRCDPAQIFIVSGSQQA
ncbi:MAG: GntR family transcriptional regulator, partial [Terriglobales bacterium]